MRPHEPCGPTPSSRPLVVISPYGANDFVVFPIVVSFPICHCFFNSFFNIFIPRFRYTIVHFLIIKFNFYDANLIA